MANRTQPTTEGETDQASNKNVTDTRYTEVVKVSQSPAKPKLQNHLQRFSININPVNISDSDSGF